MKKVVAALILAASLYACGGAGEKKADVLAEKKEEPAKDDISKNPDYEKGLSLIANSDCLTCHKVEENATGPSYRNVANKYENNQATIDMLAGKIITGGAGNWGQVPMTAHPAVPLEDAKQMVKYVMLLKNN